MLACLWAAKGMLIPLRSTRFNIILNTFKQNWYFSMLYAECIQGNIDYFISVNTWHCDGGRTWNPSNAFILRCRYYGYLEAGGEPVSSPAMALTHISQNIPIL